MAAAENVVVAVEMLISLAAVDSVIGFTKVRFGSCEARSKDVAARYEPEES